MQANHKRTRKVLLLFWNILTASLVTASYSMCVTQYVCRHRIAPLKIHLNCVNNSIEQKQSSEELSQHDNFHDTIYTEYRSELKQWSGNSSVMWLPQWFQCFVGTFIRWRVWTVFDCFVFWMFFNGSHKNLWDDHVFIPCIVHLWRISEFDLFHSRNISGKNIKYLNEVLSSCTYSNNKVACHLEWNIYVALLIKLFIWLETIRKPCVVLGLFIPYL